MALDPLSMATELLIALAPEAIVEAQRHESVVTILKKLGLDPESPPPDFDACYTRAFVEFGAQGAKPKALLEYFRTREVREAYRRFYETNAASELLNVREWHTVGDDLKAANVDLPSELKQFTTVFERYVVRSASPIDLLVLREIRAIPQRVLATQNVKAEIPDPSPKPIPPDEQVYHPQIDAAENLRANGQPTAAKHILETIKREIGTKSVSDYLQYRLETNLGACELDLGQNDQVIAHFERALLFEPNNYKAVANAAYAKLLRGEFEIAVDYAERTLQLSPDAAKTSAPAISLDARARLHNFDEIEALIDERYIENADYLRAAGVCFVRASKYEQAEEMFRRALLLDPNDDYGMMILAQVLYLRQREQAVKQIFFSAQETKAIALDLTESLELTDRAVASLERKENRKQLHEVLAGRAGILAAKGELEAAIRDCERVLAADPHHSLALYNRGLIAHELRDYDTAIRCLSEVLNGEHVEMDPYIPLASAYLEIGQPSLALDVLDKTPAALKGTRADFFVIRSEAQLKLGKTSEIDATLQEMLAAHPNDSAMLEAVAHIEFLENQSDAALNHLLQAYTYAEGRQKHHLALRLAQHYLIQQDYAQAVVYYETLGSLLEGNAALARDYLIALYNGKYYGKAYRFAQTLRATGSTDSTIIQILAWLCELTGDYKSAGELYAQLADLSPGEPRFLVAQARAEFRRAEYDKVRELALRIKTLPLEDPVDLIQIAQMLVFLGDCDDGMKLAYKARLLGMNNSEIHYAYIGIFHACDQAGHSRFEVHQVSPDTAVRVREKNEPPKWLTIYSALSPNRARDEFAVNDTTAQALLGHAQGDVVELSAGLYEPIVYTIEEVQSIYVRAFQETFMNFGTWFPEDKSMSRVRIEDNDPTPMLRIVAGKSVQTGEIYQEYERGVLTFSQFAAAAGKNEFDLWAGLIGKPNHRIMASRGSHREQEYNLQIARAAREVTLDITALMTARFLGILEKLPQGFEKLYLAQAVLDRITHHLADMQMMVNSTFGVVGFEDGRFIWEEIPKERMRAEIERTQKLLEFIKQHAQVIAIDARVLDWLGDERARHISDQVSLATLLVGSQTKSAFYVDDIRLRENGLATGNAGFWTQPMLKSWLDKGMLTQEEYFDYTIQLVRAHYHFTSIDAPLIKFVLNKNNLHITPEVAEIFKALEGPNTTEDVVVRIVCECLRDVWFSGALSEQRVFILDQCLNSLTKGRVVPIVLQKLDQYLEIRLNLAPVALDQIRAEMNNWYKAHQIGAGNNPRL